MTTDRHTPCLACPIQVRSLYASTQVLLALLEPVLDGDLILEDVERQLAEAHAVTRIALQQLAPHVDAHLENQQHALSPDLAGARFPGTLDGPPVVQGAT